MPGRSEKRDGAKAAYLERAAQGERPNLRVLAERLGVPYQTIRNWKKADRWDEALPKRARGGQPGNRNSAGHKNAAGSHKGAPAGNKNAEKDGAYSAVFFDMLTEEERAFCEKTPLESREALAQEMKILKYREHKILAKIEEYERAGQDALYLDSVTDMRTPDKGRDGAQQKMGMYRKESAFARIMKLQEALYKVQGRIARTADSLRAIEESGERMTLEQKKLDILRMRATGVFEVDMAEEEA